MATYLVTGGAGFIGSNLVHELLRRGERVRVLDNFSTGRRENLRGLDGKIEIIEGDLGNPAAVKQAVHGTDLILHHAALPSVTRSMEDPTGTHAANATGTLNLLVAARASNVKRVVYASSSSVYGDSPVLPKEEGMRPEPKSPYAASKVAGEGYCLAFWKAYGLESVCLRYFNVFGPRQDPNSPYGAVIPNFITTMLQGEPPTIFGDGLQSRDFTYVEDVVEATLLAATVPAAAGQVLNIACGRQHTLWDLVRILNDVLGTETFPRLARPRSGDVRHSQAEVMKARALLGFRPRIDFEEGLRRTVLWIRASTSRPTGTGNDRTGIGERTEGRPAILIAEDDPMLTVVLQEYLDRFDLAVHTTDSHEEARRWLEEEGGLLLLDGSVFKQMGIPLADLPRRAVICSGDADLVEEARRLGLTAFCKGRLDDLGKTLRQIAAEGPHIPSPAPIPLRRRAA